MGVFSALSDLVKRSSSDSQAGYSQVPAHPPGEAEPYHLPDHVDDNDSDTDSPAEPLIKTGVEGSLAWQRMSPADKTITYATFGLLGMGVLLPFNSLITPTEYFRSSFAATQFATTFSSWIVVSYNVISILFGLHATATGGFERSSPRRRIITSSLVIIFAVFCLAISTTFHNPVQGAQVHTSPTAYFYFILFLGFLLSAGTAYLQNAVVSLSTAFGGGGKFMGAMLSGQGIVGVGISIVGIVSAWSQTGAEDPKQPQTSEQTAGEIARAATFFFTMSVLLMAFVLLVFVRLARSELYAQVMAKQVASIAKVDDDDDGSDQDDHDVEHAATRSMAQSWHSERSISHPHYRSILKRVPGFKSLSHETRQSLLRLASVQSKVAWDCFAVAFIFTITLSVFPALTSAVQSVYTTNGGDKLGHGGRQGSPVHVPIDLTSPQLFVPFHFLLFNASDLIGRTLPSLTPRALIRKGRVLVFLTLARTVFVPLFLACNVVSSSKRTGPISSGSSGEEGAHGLAALMQSSDAPFFGLMLLFGLTNGLVSTCIMISGPTRRSLINAKGASEGPLAATLLSFWLCMGLAAGSALSFWTVPA